MSRKSKKKRRNMRTGSWKDLPAVIPPAESGSGAAGPDVDLFYDEDPLDATATFIERTVPVIAKGFLLVAVGFVLMSIPILFLYYKNDVRTDSQQDVMVSEYSGKDDNAGGQLNDEALSKTEKYDAGAERKNDTDKNEDHEAAAPYPSTTEGAAAEPAEDGQAAGVPDDDKIADEEAESVSDTDIIMDEETEIEPSDMEHKEVSKRRDVVYEDLMSGKQYVLVGNVLVGTVMGDTPAEPNASGSLYEETKNHFLTQQVKDVLKIHLPMIISVIITTAVSIYSAVRNRKERGRRRVISYTLIALTLMIDIFTVSLIMLRVARCF